jgi:hypothetical protein
VSVSFDIVNRVTHEVVRPGPRLVLQKDAGDVLAAVKSHADLTPPPTAMDTDMAIGNILVHDPYTGLLHQVFGPTLWNTFNLVDGRRQPLYRDRHRTSSLHACFARREDV